MSVMDSATAPEFDQAYCAHSATDAATGTRRFHGLVEHLQSVASTAADFSANWGSQWAYLAGLWHDLGKFRPGFQSYIRQVDDAHIEGRLPAASEKSHSAAGALLAIKLFEREFGPAGGRVARILAYAIAGHHAGLADWTAGLDTRLLAPDAPSATEYAEALAACERAAPNLLPLPADFDLAKACKDIPGARDENPLALSLWIRMLFSALVDADFLDTEAFMDQARADRRRGYPPLDHYRELLEAHLGSLAATVAASGRSKDAVMLARSDVLWQCQEKATLAPGVFSLTVPTGGGKTLSSLAFALRHACAHRMRRVIYAIPYTSIIEQTADVFGRIFGTDSVIEHHSQAETTDSQETARSRLACENWDGPLVVTTNVQLFESLFAARTSRCRKLHRIAGSVIVLDEAQLLPPEFLQPILDALNVLVAHYGVTVLLCTATQPALGVATHFDARKNLRGLPPAMPLIDDEAALFRHLHRVAVEWPSDLQTPVPISELAQSVAEHDCVLTIVNTRNDAAELVAALDGLTGDETLHLSAALCGQHRADTIAKIRERLAARRSGADTKPLRVVSTQLVEAGVDIDFPVVFRALAGLDSIAQAAGRCNREGIQREGRVIVFVRGLPKSLTSLRAGVEATRSTLAAGVADALAPAAFQHYFPLYYAGYQSLDKHGIVDALRHRGDFAFCFREAAEKFRLVDDRDQVSVVVPYARPQDGSNAEPSPIALLIERLRQGDTDRWLLRKQQRYTVTARRNMVSQWQVRGDVEEVQPGLFVLVDPLRYDRRLGLLPEGTQPDASHFVC